MNHLSTLAKTTISHLPSRSTRILRRAGIMLLGTAFVATSLLLASPVTAEGPVKAAKAGVAICMAHVRGTDDLIFSFGGKGTTDVTAVRKDPGIPGWHIVTCTGKYPENGDLTDLIINTSARLGGFVPVVTGSERKSYSTTQIVLEVFVWHSSDLTFLDNEFYVTIFLGREP